MSKEPTAAIDRTLQAQHGLVTSEQAVRLLGPSRKARWVAERRLVSLQPGVFRVLGAPETWHQALLAASLAADAVVSHRSAAELWGLIQPAGYIEVTVHPERRPRLRPPAIAHRVLDVRPDLAATRQGIRLTDPARTVIDLGLVMPAWSVDRALSRGLTSRLFDLAEVERLRLALGRKGRNGTGVVQSLLDARSLTGGKEESVLERRFMGVVSRYELDRPDLQHEVWHAGRFVARVDAAYPDRRLAIEVDGYEFHAAPDAFQRDRTRQNDLVALGWTVLRFTWDDVVKRPAMVASTIRDALERLAAA